MRYALVLGTGPAAEPVGTADLRTHCRVVGTADDAAIEAYGKAARRLAEQYTNRSFITQTWDLYLDCWPQGTEIPLPRPPLQSVAFVKYIDEAGAEQTLGTAAYHVDNKNQPPRIVLDDDATWPDIDTRPNAVHVQYVAGYGTAGTSVPETIQHAIRLTTAHFFEHRGDRQQAAMAGAEPQQLPPVAQILLFPEIAY